MHQFAGGRSCTLGRPCVLVSCLSVVRTLASPSRRIRLLSFHAQGVRSTNRSDPTSCRRRLAWKTALLFCFVIRLPANLTFFLGTFWLHLNAALDLWLLLHQLLTVYFYFFLQQERLMPKKDQNLRGRAWLRDFGRSVGGWARFRWRFFCAGDGGLACARFGTLVRECMRTYSRMMTVIGRALVSCDVVPWKRMSSELRVYCCWVEIFNFQDRHYLRDGMESTRLSSVFCCHLAESCSSFRWSEGTDERGASGCKSGSCTIMCTPQWLGPEVDQLAGVHSGRYACEIHAYR